MAISDLRQSPFDDDTPSVIPQPAKQGQYIVYMKKSKLDFRM